MSSVTLRTCFGQLKFGTCGSKSALYAVRTMRWEGLAHTSAKRSNLLLRAEASESSRIFWKPKKIFVKSTQRSKVFISPLVSIKIFFLSLSYKYIQWVKKNQGYLGIEHLPNIKDNEELKILNLLSVESKIREIFSVFGF